MTTPFDTTGQFAWDSTSLSLASTCQRKYLYKMLEGWSPDRVSEHLIFGNHYATALEHYHKHRAENVNHEDALALIVHEALIATWQYETEPSREGDEGYPDSVIVKRDADGERIGHAWVSLHNLKTRENLIRTIIWYFDHFSEDSTSTIILANGKPGVEYTFKLPVDNNVLFCGHIDRLVTYSDDPFVMDQKTTGTTISARFFAEFDLSLQMSMYTFAGKVIYAIPVKGVIIDAAQIAVGFTRYERGFTFRQDEQLNEWYDEMQGLIATTRENYVRWNSEVKNRERHFPRNLSSCNNYGGCEFRDICAKPKQFRDQFLRASFTKVEPWNPLRAR